MHTDNQIGDCVGAWFRPNFDTVLYPYLPPHVTRPKEIRKLFIVPLLERCCFAVSQLVRPWPAFANNTAAAGEPSLHTYGPQRTHSKHKRQIQTTQHSPTTSMKTQVPRNYRLVAVPLFELLDAAARFGPVNASIPQMLSR